MSNYVEYRDGTDTAASPSSSVWADCPLNEFIQKGTGVTFFDDFTNFGLHISDQDTQQYASYIDTGVTIKQAAGVTAGQIEVAGNDADNDEGHLATHGPVGMISTAAPKKMWFECRVKKASIANNALAFFVGLSFDHGSSIPLSSADTLVDNSGAPGEFSFLGFHCDQADGDAINFMYRAEGQAQTDAVAGAVVPVADTFVKLGFVYDPDADADKRIAVYVNGARNATYVTQANLEAATFPDAEPLGLALYTKVGTGSQESKLQMDWWKFAQVR